jgi:hypothetical protein
MKELKQIALIFCCIVLAACSETRQDPGVEDAKAGQETVIPDSSAESFEQAMQTPAEDTEAAHETAISDSSAESSEQSSQTPAEGAEESQKPEEGPSEKQ